MTPEVGTGGFSAAQLWLGLKPDQALAAARAWLGDDAVAEAGSAERIAAAMGSADTASQRVATLPGSLGELLRMFLDDPTRERTVRDVATESPDRWPSWFEAEAALAALMREGVVFPTGDSVRGPDAGYAVPVELARGMQTWRERERGDVLSAITLRGFLKRRFERANEGGDADSCEQRVRRLERIYRMETSIASRVEALPEDVRAVWDVAIKRYGGFLPVEEIARVVEHPPAMAEIREALEAGMLGTVAELPLRRFGIKPSEESVIAFHEVAIACLRRHSEDSPMQVDERIDAGSTLIRNIVTFLDELEASRVQFTIEGRLYRASERRLARCLEPLEGEFLAGEALVEFIFRFCLARGLIDRRGERALRPTDDGRAFAGWDLDEQRRALLMHSVVERGEGREDYHQLKLRRILLNLLRRVDAETWYELSLFPFLARGHYVSRFEELGVEAHFRARRQVRGYAPNDNLQQIGMRLLAYIKRRLFSFGLLELGYRDGRPVALRPTDAGVRLFRSLGEAGREAGRTSGGARPSGEGAE